MSRRAVWPRSSSSSRSSARLLALFGLGLAVAPALACETPRPATPYPTAEPPEGEPAVDAPALAPGHVGFLGRAVDLRPFLEGFPYTHFSASLEHDRLFFLETGDRYVLRMATLDGDGALDLAAAPAVTDVDWSKRSLWGVRYHAASNRLWLHADFDNDERMNLFSLDMKPFDAGGPLVDADVVTTADYVYGWNFSEDETRVAYLARTGTKAPYTTCLHIRDAIQYDARTDQQVVCDTPELRFTWSSPKFSPDGKRIYFAAQVDGDRKRVQLVEVDLRRERPVPKPITDVDVPRDYASMLDGWVDGERLLFTANDEGFGNVYSWSRRTKKTERLTNLDEELLGAVALDRGVLIAHGTPAGSTVELVTDDGVFARDPVPGKVGFLDGHGDRVIWTQAAPDKVFEANLSQVLVADGELADADRPPDRPLVRLAPELEAQLVQCEAEAVSIPTFDGRSLHAFVLRPRAPLGEAEGGPVAMVRSFYGGDNVWTRYDHVLCGAGITVVSASVRGSSGFGKAFHALNDRDLGGDEIVDLFWVARFIETELGIPGDRIGVYGRSHGGYATMRAMTFPPETNGRGEAYRFAFGLAEAGFSDIVAFHDATNIPDWVVLEAGDPSVPEDLAKLKDRSPLSHVDRLEAPIFLLHGANDWRVPVEGSRAFVEAATAAGKTVRYHEVEGQGHHIEGQERIVEAWQARLAFVEDVLTGELR